MHDPVDSRRRCRLSPDVGRPEPRRARREVPHRRRPASSTASASTRAPATPARTSAACGPAAARCSRRRRSPTKRPSGWQQVLFADAGARSPPTRPTSPRITPTSATTRRQLATSATPASTARRCTRSPTASTAATASSPTARAGSRRRPSTRPTTGSTSCSTAARHDAAAIANVAGTPIDSAMADVTWTTDEQATSAVDYSTDSTFPPALTVTVPDFDFVTAHSIRLTGLVTNTTYFFRVRSTDRAGNQAMKPSVDLPPQSFTMPSPTLHDTLTGDFAAGALSGAYIAEDGDGEVMLAPQGEPNSPVWRCRPIGPPASGAPAYCRRWRRQADRRRRARGAGRSARRPRTFARIRRNLQWRSVPALGLRPDSAVRR